MEPKTQQKLAEEIFHLQVGLSPSNFQAYSRAAGGTATAEDVRNLHDLIRRVKKQS